MGQALLVDKYCVWTYGERVVRKPPVGRPPLPAKERLSDALYIRLTPGEREAIDREARRRGITGSELVRALIRKARYGAREPVGE